jgi:hypothetical protein
MMVFATSPAHAPAREARVQIEAIADALRTSGSPLDRRGLADRLARAVRALYAVIDTGLEAPVHHEGLVECTRVLTEARAMLVQAGPAKDPPAERALAALDATISRVKRSAEEVLDVVLARRGDRRSGFPAATTSAARPFRASMAVPRLHTLARSPVALPLSVDPTTAVTARRKAAKPAPPKPQTFEQLRAAANAPPAPPDLGLAEDLPAPLVPAADEGELLRRVARDCLEDVAALRGLRKPIPTETWRDQSPFEQRLLENIDAFVALGETALPSVTLFHTEAPAPDPARAFAVALVLGCIEGTDTADVAIATLKQSPPEELPGYAEGFILAPSPAIDAELTPLLEAPNPALVGLALDVLGARGSLPINAHELVLARRDPILTAKLAGAMGLAGPKLKAIATLSNLLDEAPADALFAIACTSLLQRGDGGVRQRLRDAIRARTNPQRVAVATTLLALSGRSDDLPLLLEGLAAAPNVSSVRALGRYGHVDALGPLIALLDATDETVPIAAAEALDFITNAGLRETKDVPWTPGVVPPDGSPPPTRRVATVIVDRSAWESWHARARQRLDPRVKHRSGVPFTPSMIVDELASTAPPARRVDAALELVVATGAGARFSTTDWVGRQTQKLAELGEHVRSLGSAAGAWWYAGAGATSR